MSEKPVWDSWPALKEFNAKFGAWRDSGSLIRMPGETDAQLRQRVKMQNFGVNYGLSGSLLVPPTLVYWCRNCQKDVHLMEDDHTACTYCAIPAERWEEAEVAYNLTGDWGTVAEMSEARRRGDL